MGALKTTCAVCSIVFLSLAMRPTSGYSQLPTAPSAAAKSADAQPAAEAKPTIATMAKWLEDKDVISLMYFSEQHVQPANLRDSLKTKDDAKGGFALAPGEGAGHGSLLSVAMKVTPENIRRFLALQEELVERGYELDERQVFVWSYRCDPKVREQALRVTHEVMTAMQDAIRKALP